MITCYLFADYLDEEQGLCVCLDEQGKVTLPLEHRAIEAINTIQTTARTIIVISTRHSTLHRVELPLLSERKARLAIPFAIEEQLVQNVSELHFVFDRAHYHHNHYLVAVIDKHWLEKIIARLDALNIDFEKLTLDWFALSEHEVCMTNDALLVNDELFRGALSHELCELFLTKEHESLQGFVFNDSMIKRLPKEFSLQKEPAQTWVAQRLFAHGDGMNLCQGDFQHHTRSQASQIWYWACGIVLGSWMLLWVLTNLYHLHVYQKKINAQDAEIANIYHVFYPQDKRVISPEFRIRQRLKSGGVGSESFWPLLAKLAQSNALSALQIQQMRFQNKTLALTVTAQDFAALESVQSQLQQQGVHVTQTQASSTKQKILATLELYL